MLGAKAAASSRRGLICLAILYLTSRLVGLLSLPVFLDEAIHLASAREAQHGSLRVGASLGKWLAIQSYGVVCRLDDTLLTARLVAVGLGALTIFLLFKVGRRFNPDVPGWVGSGALLYILLPFSLFYDRLALADQFLTVLLAVIILLTQQVAEHRSRADYLALGAAILLAPLFKFSGLLLVPVPVIVMLMGTREGRWRDLSRSYALALPGIVLYVVLATPVSEASKLVSLRPLAAWWHRVAQNGREVFGLLESMLTPGLLVGLAVGGVALLVLPQGREVRRRGLTWLALMMLLVAPYVLFFEVWYPRYFLPLLVPLCLLAGDVSALMIRSARTIRWPAATLVAGIGTLILALTATSSLQLLRSPQTYPFRERMRSQFVTGWTSGYGLKEAVAAIQQLANQSPDGIRILRSSWEDVSLQGLDIYAHDLSSGVQRNRIYPWDVETIELQLTDWLVDDKPTYLLFNSAFPYPGDRDVIEKIRSGFEVEEIAHFMKPESHPGLKLWRLE